MEGAVGLEVGAIVKRVPEERMSKDARSDVATVAKGGAVQIVGQITQRGLGFFFGAVFVRLLGPDGYGLYRKVNQILANLAQLGLAGFNYASMRFIALARGEKNPAGVKGAIWVGVFGSLIASVIVGLGTFVFADEVAGVFADTAEKQDELVNLIRLGAAYIPLFSLLQVLRYCTQAYKTMVPSVVSGNIVQPVARFILGVALLVAGFDVAGAVVSLNFSFAIAALLAGYYLYKIMTPAERAAVPRVRVREMVAFALPQGGSSMLGIQSLGLGILILGAVSTDTAVGLFAIALSLQGPGTVFLGGIVNIWAPVVSDLHGRGEIERLGILYKTINRWVATFSYPVFVALILEPDLFVKFFGAEAAGAETAVVILALGNIFYTGTGPTGLLISMAGYPVINLVNSVIGVIMYTVLGIWLVPDHGIIAMAWIDAGVTVFVNSLRVIQARHMIGIHPFGKSFFKPVAASVAGGVALLLWRLVPGTGTLIDAAGLVVGGIVYLVTLKVLGLDKEEEYVFKMIKKKVFKGKGKPGKSSTPEEQQASKGQVDDE